MRVTFLALALCASLLGGCVGSGSSIPPQPGLRRAEATLTTLAGKPLRLDFAYSLNADCTSVGEVVMQVIQPPVNGTVEITRVTDYTNFAPGNQRSACNKTKSPGTKLVYKPADGFTGTDSLIVDSLFPTGTGNRIRYNIVVR